MTQLNRCVGLVQVSKHSLGKCFIYFWNCFINQHLQHSNAALNVMASAFLGVLLGKVAFMSMLMLHISSPDQQLPVWLIVVYVNLPKLQIPLMFTERLLPKARTLTSVFPDFRINIFWHSFSVLSRVEDGLNIWNIDVGQQDFFILELNWCWSF